MIMPLTSTIASVVALVLAQAASVQDPPAAPQSSAPPASAHSDAFSHLDADKDGRVSSTEADADPSFSAGFSTMDANADGFVTIAEYRAHEQANAQP